MRDGIKLSPQSQLSPPLRLSCRPFVRFVLASVHVLSAEVVDWSVVRSVSLGAGSRGRQLEMEVGASAGTVKHTVVKVLTRYHLKEDRQRVRKSRVSPWQCRSGEERAIYSGHNGVSRGEPAWLPSRNCHRSPTENF